MLQEILNQHPSSPMSILSFSLIPGGVCRDENVKKDLTNRRLSDTVLESVRLLLAASLPQLQDEGKEVALKLSVRDESVTRELMDAIAKSIGSDDVIAGGIFPHLVCQKVSEGQQ